MTDLDSYLAALDALIQPIAAHRLPGTLEPMRALLEALGHPERRYPVVVVAGSTGKGTAALRLAAGLAAGGLRVGLYTSPHLHSFRERFVVLNPTPDPSLRQRGGETDPDAAVLLPLSTERSGMERGPGGEVAAQITFQLFITHANAVHEAAKSIDFAPSTFESATALAYRWFADEAVDIAVCEIGLGGRYDAVNAAPNALALIGPIELEHAAMLGGTLERIAWHKAGVIAPGGRAVIRPPAEPAVRAVFEAEAAQQGASVVWATDIAAAGLDTLKAIGLAPTNAAIVGSIALPGRLERVTVNGRRVLIDGGHTPLSARRLAEAFDADRPGGVRVIVGMLADKDAVAYLRELDVPCVTFVCTTAPTDRARPAADLAAAYLPRDASLVVVPAFTDALADGLGGPDALLVVAGSLRLAAAAREALGLMDGEALDEALRTRALFEGAAYRGRWQRP